MRQPTRQTRRTFCRNVVRFSTALSFLSLADLFPSCNAQPKKRPFRPSVQINGTNIITNTRYMGSAFAFPEQMITAYLQPNMNRIPPYTPGISFLGVIAEDTLSAGCSSLTPCDVALVGIFKQKNGTFRYGYEINGNRQYAKGHLTGSDYKYVMSFRLNEEGLVSDPDFPRQKRYGYDFQISSGWDAATRLHGLQSSSIYANQLFIGVMDDNNDVHLPENKQLQLFIDVSGGEEAPSVIYKNNDDTSQISSQFSEAENRIVLTLVGSY
jgi:hypothetical protein